MSAPSSENRPPSLDTHPLVAKLHPDPDATANNQVLVGYFGPAKEADHVRLYTDLSFQSYFDLSKTDILGTQAANRQDENSPTVVFVKPDGKVEMIRNPDTGANFLKGAISNANLAAAAGAGCGVVLTTAACTFEAMPPQGPNAALQAPNVGCCGTLWTAGCTFPSNAAPQAPNAAGCPVVMMTTFCTIGHGQAQGPNAGCCGTLWTAGCTFPSNAAPQAPNAAGCPVVMMTTFCTIGHGQVQGPNAGCCGTLWTAGCTFPSNAAPQPAPVNTCIQVLMTTMCTVGANAMQAPNAALQAPNVGCCGTLWTAGCTFPSYAAAQAPNAAPQGPNVACCGTIWTAGCTFPSNA